jgi:ParB family chromosome partitioning protein
MAELRSVDPRTLQLNPNNPRRTPVSPAMDEQLLASIKAVGIIQPPCVTPKDDGLVIVVGNRRVKAAIEAELPVIDVMVCDADEAAPGSSPGQANAMRSVAENLSAPRCRAWTSGARSSGSKPRAGTSRPSATRSHCRSAPSAA